MVYRTWCDIGIDNVLIIQITIDVYISRKVIRMCVFLEERWRCNLTNAGSKMRELQDLETHLNRMRNFTESYDIISRIRSRGRVVAITIFLWSFGYTDRSIQTLDRNNDKFIAIIATTTIITATLSTSTLPPTHSRHHYHHTKHS